VGSGGRAHDDPLRLLPHVVHAQGSAFDLGGIIVAREVSRLRLESVTVENVWRELRAFESLEVRSCTFRMCEIGVGAFTPNGLQVVNSRFEGCLGDGIFTGTDTRDVQIAGCEFVDNFLGVGINRTQNAVAAFCSFDGGGVQYAEGSTGLIQRCTFVGAAAVTLAAGASVSLVENRVNATGLGICVYNFSHLLGERNVIDGASYAMLRSSGGATADFHGNHILKGTGPVVRTEGYVLDPVYIDLTDNDWGTTAADPISAWILDGNDPHPPWETWNGFVVFEPFAQRPIPAGQASFGELKGRFCRAPLEE
jgi:hypothetical protein